MKYIDVVHVHRTMLGKKAYCGGLFGVVLQGISIIDFGLWIVDCGLWISDFGKRTRTPKLYQFISFILQSEICNLKSINSPHTLNSILSTCYSGDPNTKIFVNYYYLSVCNYFTTYSYPDRLTSQTIQFYNCSRCQCQYITH